jgi:hypothetical protein
MIRVSEESSKSMALKRSNKNWHHINKQKILSSFLLNTPIQYELVKEIVRDRLREILGDGK